MNYVLIASYVFSSILWGCGVNPERAKNLREKIDNGTLENHAEWIIDKSDLVSIAFDKATRFMERESIVRIGMFRNVSRWPLKRLVRI